jgi:hypothetical protein
MAALRNLHGSLHRTGLIASSGCAGGVVTALEQVTLVQTRSRPVSRQRVIAVDVRTMYLYKHFLKSDFELTV